jgi:hypothetical protein
MRAKYPSIDAASSSFSRSAAVVRFMTYEQATKQSLMHPALGAGYALG